MSVQNNAQLPEIARPVLCYAVAAASTNTCTWINMKNYERVSFIIPIANGTTSTALAIGLQQASDTNGTGVKTLAFTNYWAATNAAGVQGTSADTLVKTTASSNTFNTDATTSKAGLYIIDVQSSDLDVTNSFNCVRVNPGTAAAGATLGVIAIARAADYPAAAVPSAT